jgi:acetyl esterase/lipase
MKSALRFEQAAKKGSSCSCLALALLVAQAEGLLQARAAVPDGVQTIKDVEYIPGGHERQRLDVYLPAQGTNWPLVVWVHGGAWLAGSKDSPPALRLLSQGYAVASINYRLSRHAIFPAQIQDCKAAIRWLRANAAKYGYDSKRIGVWGASAGGHLVALLGTTGDVKDFDVGVNLDQSSRVQAVVDFFGPTDLTLMSAQAGRNSKMDHDAADSPESLLVGGAIQQHKDRAQLANPIEYVSADDPPFLIMHGDKDDLVPMGQSELLHAALEKARVPSTFHKVTGAGHGFGGPEIDKQVLTFLDKQLKP